MADTTRKLKPGKIVLTALDPGGTTGVAQYVGIVDESGNIFQDYKWKMREIAPDKEDHHGQLWRLLRESHPLGEQNSFIICESFEFRQFDGDRMGISLVSKEYIGVVKLYKQITGSRGPRVVFQTASEGKGFWFPKKDATKLKAMNMYTPGSTHINDAMAHLLHYMAFKLNYQGLFKALRAGMAE